MSDAAILSQIRSDSEAASRLTPEAKANYTLEWIVTLDHGVIYRSKEEGGVASTLALSSSVS
ncbi:hypothetical protein ACLBKU_04680 [Erythrobacter sp. NE805]|uniref:hypothetical protein n=1 Tax=Erythrobacter sp. NE805 TaxID=3389875 RepID=UPI00396AFD36